MEFKEAMRIWKRMCESNGQCEHCPIPACDTTLCRAWVMMHADRANGILAKWAEEHPEKTRLDDFLDKHPRAYLDDNDTPRACAKHLGYCTECIDNGDLDKCDDCWRRPLEEVE